jgi:RNA polymerase sigma-70 factor (ECF subfamily)
MLALAYMDVLAGERWALRDPERFRAFYEEALPRVYSYFFHRCGGRAAVAEDLTQETFLAAVTEIKKGKTVETPVAWVLGIAKHKLVDHYRSEEREERRIAAAAEDRLVPDELVTWNGEVSRERALAALRSIAAPQRAALALRYLDGLSVPEVADALGRSVEATESLLARGRESFKRFYVEENGG